MTDESLASTAITHCGPSTENPFSAKADSVPIAAVRFSRKPSPSLAFASARVGANDSFSFVMNALSSWKSCQGSRVDT